jgi:uncharacterized protein
MVKVNIKDNVITIKGHANFDEFGKDIVCASISSIVITTVNGILRINNKSVNVEELKDILIIKYNKKDYNTLLLIENMISLLQELESKYPKNIKIRNEV